MDEKIISKEIQNKVNEILSAGNDRDLENFLINKKILVTTNIKGRDVVTGVHPEIYDDYMQAKKNFYTTKK